MKLRNTGVVEIVICGLCGIVIYLLIYGFPEHGSREQCIMQILLGIAFVCLLPRLRSDLRHYTDDSEH